MTETTYRTAAEDVLHEIAGTPNPRRRNPSALPVGPASLTALLVNTVEWIARHEREQDEPEMVEAHKLVVLDVVRRMTPSERFRLHCALHARINHVPLFILELTS